ncbi:Zinc finger BED domain-containing protein RICESLEEPER 4, partial [Bienertia sinuspersici]
FKLRNNGGLYLSQSGSRPPTTESVADHETIGSNIIVDPESTSKRKREEWIQIDEHRRAPVWLHYEFWLLKGEDGKPDTKYAFCKYCREHKYKASSGYGTSNASIHLKSCQAYLKFVAENPHSGAVLIRNIVEHEKLRVMLSYLQPKVQHVSRNTTLKYCVKEHEILKATLRSKLDSIDSRICFTCDCWSAITKHGYLTLTAHYVDNEWSMMEKYEKYWSDHAIILSVAVVLDPRFKLKFVKGLYSMLYVPSEVDVRVRKVYDAMVELYDYYRSSSSQTIPLPSQSYSNRSHSASSYSSHQFLTADL